MFEFDRRHISQVSPDQQHGARGMYAQQAARTAHLRYQRTRLRGAWTQLWSALTGRPHQLLDLEQTVAQVTIRGQHAAGSQPVPISQIRGSEGRAHEFNSSFAPLQSHTKQRWITVATKFELGETLPQVALVQVGDVYFVRDGHHRVSAARALGHIYIDANVTVWDVLDPAICASSLYCSQLQPLA